MGNVHYRLRSGCSCGDGNGGKSNKNDIQQARVDVGTSASSKKVRYLNMEFQGEKWHFTFDI